MRTVDLVYQFDSADSLLADAKNESVGNFGLLVVRFDPLVVFAVVGSPLLNGPSGFASGLAEPRFPQQNCCRQTTALQ